MGLWKKGNFVKVGKSPSGRETFFRARLHLAVATAFSKNLQFLLNRDAASSSFLIPQVIFTITFYGQKSEYFVFLFYSEEKKHFRKQLQKKLDGAAMVAYFFWSCIL